MFVIRLDNSIEDEDFYGVEAHQKQMRLRHR